MSTLERAIEIAMQAHTGQVDKAGAPYLLHPLRVMLEMRTPEARMAAVLHDVVEDGAWTLDDLRREGFSDDVVRAVEALTHVEPPRVAQDKQDPGAEKEARYLEYVRKASRDPIARRVKLADLRDNCDLSRIPAATARDFRRVAKYYKAIAQILEDYPDVAD